MKFRKTAKSGRGAPNNASDDSKIGFGVDQNQEANMFNMEQYGVNQDDSGTLIVNPQSIKKSRKKSPEELIDTVNRKYGILYGQNRPLLGIQADLRQMDTEDFMSYLTHNDQSRMQRKRAGSLHNDVSPEQQVQTMGSQ